MKKIKKSSTKETRKNTEKKDVISSRRTSKVSGTGLSHYILMDRKG